MKTFEIGGRVYPQYLREGNAMQYILPVAQKWCIGKGLDIGSGRYPFPGAIPIDPARADHKYNAMQLPDGEFDFIFSSHCLEHLPDIAAAIKYWTSKLKKGGVMFLYLPHPDNVDWHPENNRSHKHILQPADVSGIMASYLKVLYISGRDLAWGYSIVAVK